MLSDRLPGKTLTKIAGKPILEWLIDRIKPSKMIDDVVVATTTLKEDDAIVDFCYKKKVPYFRGSHEDVLGRVYETAKAFAADATLRIGPDDPYVDAKFVDQYCQTYLKTNADYILNFDPATYPWGINIDMLTTKFLDKLNTQVKDKYDREHVSPYIIRNRKKFNVVNIALKEKDLTGYRLTIDYAEDLYVAKKILNHFKDKDFDFWDIVKFLDKNPKIKEANSKYLPKVKVSVGD